MGSNVLVNKNFRRLVTLFQFPSVPVNRNYALTPLEGSTKFGRDERGIQCSQQFQCETLLASKIREVFSVLANQEIFSWKAKTALQAAQFKMNFVE